MVIASLNLSRAFEDGMHRPIQCDNEIAILVVLFLLVVTGVRFTIDPFCFLPRLISDDLSILYTEDKVISVFHACRVVARITNAHITDVLVASGCSGGQSGGSSVNSKLVRL